MKNLLTCYLILKVKGVKLFLILGGLTNVEIRDLKKVIQSPLYNTNKRLIYLYEALRKYHPNFPNTLAFKKKLFVKTFPSEAYDDQKLRRTFSQLREVTEQFLIYQQLNKNKFEKEKLLASAYKERKLLDFYQTKTEQLIQQIEVNPCLDVDLLRERAFLAKEQCFLHKADFEKSKAYLTTFTDYLNRYFVAERCLVAADYKVLEKTLGKKEEQQFTKFVHQMSFQLIDKSQPNIQLYTLLSDLVEQADEPTFHNIKNFYFEHFNKLTSKDRLIIFTHLTNFCTNQINLGEKTYRTQLMNLYKMGLKERLLINPNGQLDAVLYRNIGMLAILNGEFDWAAQFLTDYEKELAEIGRSEVKRICMGFLHFYQHEYDETIRLLNQKDFKNINNILSAKDLMLRSYFELFLLDRDYYSLFNAFAQSFSIYIRRKGLDKSKGKRYMNLIKFLLTIVNKIYAIKDCSLLVKQWETDLYATQTIAARNWVFQKIDSFKQN